MSIAVIAGLGNPGLKYRHTRHNVGFDLVERFALKYSATWKHESRFEADTAVILHAGRKLMLIKPRTFMNASGRSLGAVLRYRRLPPESLLVVYDDLNLEVGRSKLSLYGSAGGHNGIADILTEAGTGFARFRIGIGGKPDKTMDLADYVLSRFSKNEQTLLEEQTPFFIEQMDLILSEGVEPAMNIINQRKAPPHERNNHK